MTGQRQGYDKSVAGGTNPLSLITDPESLIPESLIPAAADP